MEGGISENIYKRFLQMASVQNNPPDSLKDTKDAYEVPSALQTLQPGLEEGSNRILLVSGVHAPEFRTCSEKTWDVEVSGKMLEAGLGGGGNSKSLPPIALPL